MFAYLSRRGTRPRTTARLRRVTAALAAVTSGLLAWAAAVPAASAAILIPDPGAGGAYAPVPATPPAAPVQVIAAGGMPGWQITLIALAAALAAATAAVFLDRTRASRRSASATG
jgi:hypothetical protein